MARAPAQVDPEPLARRLRVPAVGEHQVRVGELGEQAGARDLADRQRLGVARRPPRAAAVRRGRQQPVVDVLRVAAALGVDDRRGELVVRVGHERVDACRSRRRRAAGAARAGSMSPASPPAGSPGSPSNRRPVWSSPAPLRYFRPMRFSIASTSTPSSPSARAARSRLAAAAAAGSRELGVVQVAVLEDADQRDQVEAAGLVERGEVAGVDLDAVEARGAARGRPRRGSGRPRSRAPRRRARPASA